MAYRCVQLKGINGTQMTPYGANYSNYGGYHDFTVSETGTAGYKKYSDFVEYIGENYLKHAYTGTQGPDEEINFVTVYEDEYFTIQDSVTLPYQDPESSRTRFLSYVGIRILYQGEVLVGSYSSASSTGSDVVTDKMSFCFVVDDDNHLGQIILVSQGPNNNQYFWTFKTMGLKKDWGKIYNILIGRILVGATVRINYYLPDYDYTYAKITYKQDSEPDSETDGESVEILKDETSVNIEGLEEENTYYFKIFTDKSESEAFPYTVGEIPGPVIPPDLQPYVDLLASYGVGTNQTSSLTNCQDYSGNSNTVSMEGYSVCIDGNFNVNGNQYYMYVMTNCDIRVTNNSGSISVEYSCTMASYDTIKTWGRSMWGEYSHSGNRIEYLALGIWTPAVPLDFYQPYNVDNVGITFTTSFDSMVNCMNYLTQHFRRCNLYVDGKQWLKVN